MKRQISTLLLTVGVLCAANAQDQNSTPPPQPKTDFSKIFKNDTEKTSYAIGMSWAGGLKARLKSQDLPFDPDAMIKGFSDTMSSGTPLITDEQVKEILNELNKQIRAKMDEKRKQQAEEMRVKGEKNKSEGAAFLDANKSQPGVVTLPSGLQYKVLVEGGGASPKSSDSVTVNYRGTLIDGTEFDSSAKRGPFTTKVSGGIIKGWTEALQLMKPGAKWQLFIPPDLAYGSNPAGPLIAPNATLIFEIELLSIQTASATPAGVNHTSGTPLTSDIIKVPSAEEIKKGAKIETIKAEDIDKAKANTNQ